MSGSMYELIAIAARYLFAALMVLIVIRAWKITLVDARRAAVLRRLSPETGVCGEFLIMTGGGKVREGMRFPVIREGMIGSAAKADIRLRASGVHRSHAYFELTKNGLRVRTHASARLYNARGESKREVMLGDGAKITVGSIEMMLILTVAVDAPAEESREELFDIPDDSPAFAPRPARPTPPPRIPRERPAYAPPSYAVNSDPEIPISRPAPVRETAADDIFLERRQDTPDSIPGWDDPWSEPAKKPVVTKKSVDDPFDF
ncbi:MAG: hypothetical protein IJC56_01700 [Clostridia bacterium]|nr:hypothetical protein [Clostridia bacterium]